LIDLQGDLANLILDRIPAEAADWLVILDPSGRGAVPASNPLSALAAGGRLGEGAEWAADPLTSVFSGLYRQWWGAPDGRADALSVPHVGR
jgi:hypothetical protein